MGAIAIDALLTPLQAYGITPEDFDRVRLNRSEAKRIADFLELRPEVALVLKEFSLELERYEDSKE